MLLPTAGAPVRLSLQGMAAKLWALEAATLHFAAADADNERYVP